MKTGTRIAGAVAIALACAMSVGVAKAAQVDNVVLGDKGSKYMVKASKTELKAGTVTFDVSNRPDSSSQHEMIVVRLTPSQIKDPDSLPYNQSTAKVYEDRIDDRGEVSELDPGKSGSLTVKLEPGTYMLFCNVAGHYRMKMYTIIHVN